jgi:hypothetical protein
MAGCKKHPNSYTSSKMNGNWIALGYVAIYASEPAPPDAFISLPITVLNGTTVVIAGYDTIVFKSVDPSSHVITFSSKEYTSSYRLNYEYLSYNPQTNTIGLSVQHNTSSGGMIMDVATDSCRPNPLLKSYIDDIIGTKVMSGKGYDTLSLRTPSDSTYDLNVTMHFSKVNDSTIAFDSDILHFGDRELHFKSTDDLAKTITFQNFHSTNFEISSLTYNYITKQIVFEQQARGGFWGQYIILQ